MYVRERSMMKWGGHREYCFMCKRAVNRSFEIKYYKSKTITYEVNEIIFLMPLLCFWNIFLSQHMVRWSQISSSLQLLYFLYPAFQMNNFISFIKSRKRITDSKCGDVIWNFISSHFSVFRRVQTETFPRKSNLHWKYHNKIFFWGQRQRFPKCEGSNILSRKEHDIWSQETLWKSGRWGLSVLGLGQVTWFLCTQNQR